MRTDKMMEWEEQKLRDLVINSRGDLIRVSKRLHTALRVLSPVRDRHIIGTDERANLEAQEITIEKFLSEVDSFIDSTSQLLGS